MGGRREIEQNIGFLAHHLQRNQLWIVIAETQKQEKEQQYQKEKNSHPRLTFKAKKEKKLTFFEAKLGFKVKFFLQLLMGW